MLFFLGKEVEDIILNFDSSKSFGQVREGLDEFIKHL